MITLNVSIEEQGNATNTIVKYSTIIYWTITFYSFKRSCTVLINIINGKTCVETKEEAQFHSSEAAVHTLALKGY